MKKQWATIFIIFFLIVSTVFYLSYEHPSSSHFDNQYKSYGYIIGFIAGGATQLLLLCMLITYIPALGYWFFKRKVLPGIKTLAWVIGIFISVIVLFLSYKAFEINKQEQLNVSVTEAFEKTKNSFQPKQNAIKIQEASIAKELFQSFKEKNLAINSNRKKVQNLIDEYRKLISNKKNIEKKHAEYLIRRLKESGISDREFWSKFNEGRRNYQNNLNETSYYTNEILKNMEQILNLIDSNLESFTYKDGKMKFTDTDVNNKLQRNINYIQVNVKRLKEFNPK